MLIYMLYEPDKSKLIDRARTTLHRMLHISQPGSQKAVDGRMASTTVVLGMSASSLRDYLVESRDLHLEKYLA
jgi:hypothetical protein